MADLPVVMISSTARDLPEHRQKVMEACQRAGCFPRMMEHLSASDAGSVEASLLMVDESDVYVGIFAHRYGTVPEGSEISITEMEYERAGIRGIPRLIYLMADDHPVLASDVAQGPGADKLRVLKSRLKREHVDGFFSSPEQLETLVLQSLYETRQSGRTAPGTAMMRVRNIRPPRNPNFTGREELLGDLREGFVAGESPPLPRALTGLGGIGKTQLAVEYAHRHADEYDIVWWVRSEEPAALAEDYAALTSPEGVTRDESANRGGSVDTSRRWLESHGRWLLVFDNASGIAQLLEYLPQGGGGHVLITSRNAIWAGRARILPVPPLPRPESAAFLCRRTGSTDGGAADELAGELGDLPLALEQAASYVETTGITLSQYVGLFRSRRTDLWDRQGAPPDYPDTVRTTWSLAMDRLRDESPAAGDLLNLGAFLAPEEMPLGLLRAGDPEHLPERLAGLVSDPLSLNEARAALRRYSLADVRREGLSIHRLVQAVTRERLPEEDRRMVWAQAAVRLLRVAFPYHSDDVQTWPECARLLPHAFAAVRHAEELRVAPDAIVGVLNQVGLYLWRRGEYRGARAALERALSVARETAPAGHRVLVTYSTNLGLVLRDLGDEATARDLSEFALRAAEQAYDSDHPEVAVATNNLGLSLLSADASAEDLVRAEELFARALRITQRWFGPNHRYLCIYGANLGGALERQGNLVGAQREYERALGVAETAHGGDHPAVASVLMDLGDVLADMRELDEARRMLDRALTITRIAYGPVHTQISSILTALLPVYQLRGERRRLIELAGSTLAISERVYGSRHPRVVRDLTHLASILQRLGQTEASREQYERALEIGARIYAPDHLKLANLRSRLRTLRS